MRLAYISDLTHVVNGVTTSRVFPLAAGFLATYAKRHFGPALDVNIFKYIEDLDQAATQVMPNFLCMSNYAWNSNLAYAYSKRAKELNPDLIVIFGGPNFPTSLAEQTQFMRERPAIDFYICGEGEEAFVSLLSKLMDDQLDSSLVKARQESLDNCCYLYDDRLIKGVDKRIQDITTIPDPYSAGIMDQFFSRPLIPLFETTRGCPFSCTFCYSGKKSENKIASFTPESTVATLEYIASHISDCDELYCADLNLGMYERDIQTCEAIAKIQKKSGYPKFFAAYAGKNKPDRVIQAIELLNGSWAMGSSMQSTDTDVLEAIKRKNISSDKLLMFVDYAKATNSIAYFELILGLPLDSKEKHFESVRLGVETGLNSCKIYQLTFLLGTEVASPESRLKYGYISRWRVMPRCFGVYEMLGKDIAVAEVEEIAIGNSTLTTEDYLDCRLLDFCVEAFINSDWFEEVMALFRKLGFSAFDFLLFVKERRELYCGNMLSIFDRFEELTMSDLFDSKAQINQFISDVAFINEHISGARGSNELNECKALCFRHLDDVFETIYGCARVFLEEKGVLVGEMRDYLMALKTFTFMRKFPYSRDAEELVHSFAFDFEAIHALKYEVDPLCLDSSQVYTVCMWHDKDQEKQISNLNRFYGDSLAGIGKMLQIQNMKKFNRRFGSVPRVVES